jgi:hypothetical protein
MFVYWAAEKRWLGKVEWTKWMFFIKSSESGHLSIHPLNQQEEHHGENSDAWRTHTVTLTLTLIISLFVPEAAHGTVADQACPGSHAEAHTCAIFIHHTCAIFTLRLTLALSSFIQCLFVLVFLFFPWVLWNQFCALSFTSVPYHLLFLAIAFTAIHKLTHTVNLDTLHW